MSTARSHRHSTSATSMDQVHDKTAATPRNLHKERQQQQQQHHHHPHLGVRSRPETEQSMQKNNSQSNGRQSSPLSGSQGSSTSSAFLFVLHHQLTLSGLVILLTVVTHLFTTAVTTMNNPSLSEATYRHHSAVQPSDPVTSGSMWGLVHRLQQQEQEQGHGAGEESFSSRSLPLSYKADRQHEGHEHKQQPDQKQQINLTLDFLSTLRSRSRSAAAATASSAESLSDTAKRQVMMTRATLSSSSSCSSSSPLCLSSLSDSSSLLSLVCPRQPAEEVSDKPLPALTAPLRYHHHDHRDRSVSWATKALYLQYALPQPLPDDNNQETKATTTTQQLYGKGWDDLYLIGFWIMMWTFLRESTMRYLFMPLGRSLGVGIPASLSKKNLSSSSSSTPLLLTKSQLASRENKLIRFAEQGWLVIYYSIFWTMGTYLLYHSPFWNDTSFYWRDYPKIQLSGLVKWYYLVQFSFWCQQFLLTVLGFEQRRKDFKELVGHHIITTLLVAGSYSMHLTSVGLAVLFSMDLADLVLPACKMLKYAGYDGLANVGFLLFLISWIGTRHIYFGRVIWSCWTEPMLYTDMKWQPQDGYYFTPNVLNGFLILLCGLYSLLIFWLAMILKVATKVLRGENSEDVRSDTEPELEQEPEDNEKEEDEEAEDGQDLKNVQVYFKVKTERGAVPLGDDEEQAQDGSGPDETAKQGGDDQVQVDGVRTRMQRVGRKESGNRAL